MFFKNRIIISLIFGMNAFALLADGEGSKRMPMELEKATLEDKSGATIPKDIVMINQDGKEVRLGDYFHKGHPVILTLGYYGCPMLCTLVLNGLVKGLKEVSFSPGDDYKIVSLSIDHREGHDLAKKKQEAYMKALDIKDPDVWTFHVTSKEEAARLAKAVGFNYYYDKKIDQFAHGAGFFVLSEEGVLSRTLFGISFKPGDIKLALNEAGEGKIGSFIDKIILSCFHYDPDSHRYGVYILGVMRLGGLLTVLLLGLLLTIYFRNEKKRIRAYKS